MLLFVNNAARKTDGRILKQKSEPLSKFKERKALVEKETGHQIKRIRTNGGGEHTSNVFAKYRSGDNIRTIQEEDIHLQFLLHGGTFSRIGHSKLTTFCSCNGVVIRKLLNSCLTPTISIVRSWNVEDITATLHRFWHSGSG